MEKIYLLLQRHGSGKTTVLVERIINIIINKKVDIDKLLIVTFTNAAAGEMRQRILDALYEEIDKNPENENLQKQILLLNKANISTIHAFCLEVIKNYFYEIDVSSNFRIGDTQEIELLKQEALEEIFEELYEEQNQEFINLVNTYVGYRDDVLLKDLVLKVYNYSQSMPFPEEWINSNIEKFNLDSDLDFAKTKWGEILIEYLKQEVFSCILELEKIGKKLKENIELEKYSSTITNDINLLKPLLNEEKWDDIYTYLLTLKFESWPRDKKTDCDFKDNCKEIRDNIKDRIKNFSKRIFLYSSHEAVEDIISEYSILKDLQKVIIKFSNKFAENKKEKNIIDFNDIEHFALKILLKEENGKYVPTEVAKIYRQKFVEIAIDEYQDSNLVQEYILNSISNNNNIFMVGDAKQSIYQFRGARPKLFLEKYDTYSLADNEENICTEDTKIQLFQNFRSRKNILDFTNIVFENIMSKKLGDIEYNKSEYLNASAQFEETTKKVGGKIEFNIIDLKEQENEDEEETEKELIEKSQQEAIFVANRINKLLKEDYYVFDKKEGYRKLTYKDIVILLRTTQDIAVQYEKELNKLEIPVFSDTSSSYFETEEIEIILSVLKIIDNPDNDIPLVCVLRSPIGGFTDNELIEIRLNSGNTSYYNALLEMANSEENIELKSKVVSFLNMLNKWQFMQEYLALDELIWYIYEETGFYDYTITSPDGEIKTANLKLLFEKAKDYEKASFKGLYNFINYIDKIKTANGDLTSAKLIGENENVVRIMSIHKSKGLEFPVVFLCGTGKQFNLQDLNQTILLHQDIGFGPKVIDYERKIEYNTLAKEAIRIKLLNETLSEEMRLLYVALTRAKEKLIITGYDKNLGKSLENKENIISDNKISISALRKAKSYLEWLEFVMLNKKENLKEILEVNYYNKKQIESKEEEKNVKNYKDVLKAFINSADKNKQQAINDLLSWEYKYKESTQIEGKASVTGITHKQENKVQEAMKKPKFLEDTKKLSSAEIGTLMHLVMQKLDFRIIYTKETADILIQKLILNNIITQNEANYIDIDKIIAFSNSMIYKDLQEAKQIHKEQPFYIYLDSSEVYGTKEKEKILVQGIIDLYYINKNDEIVLIDYKTDYVKDEKELIEKYKKQLDIYKRALEQALHKKVSTTYIYSLYLNKEILL